MLTKKATHAYLLASPTLISDQGSDVMVTVIIVSLTSYLKIYYEIFVTFYNIYVPSIRRINCTQGESVSKHSAMYINCSFT